MTRRTLAFYCCGLFMLGICILSATAVGSTPMRLAAVARVLVFKSGLPVAAPSHTDEVVVWSIRFPRVAVAGVVGAGLAAAGTLMQALFRNPLAEPGLVGAGSGALLGGVLSFVLGWSASGSVALPLCAMTGALLALGLVYAFATQGGTTSIATLLLAGIAASTLLSAAASLLLSFFVANWQIAQEILFWTMGGLEGRTWTHVWLSAPFVIAGLIAAALQAREADLLMQGEEAAASFGVDVENAKRLMTLTAAVLTGACVAVAGSIGFVGLVVPHGVRLLLGPSNRRLLPASSLAGAVFLIACDLLARTIHPPTELRLGIVTALIGGPVFIFLLFRQQRKAGQA